jgi:putative FmdB family regulatory protein
VGWPSGTSRSCWRNSLPTYEYRCLNGHTFDDPQPMPGQATKVCPTCGERARKQVCAVGLVFKGSGFHDNDYGPYGPKEGT